MAERPPVARSSAPAVRERGRWFRFLVGAAVFSAVAGLLTGTFLYLHYSRLIDEKLKGGPFPTTSMIFAAPKSVAVGDEITVASVVTTLRNAGYSESENNRLGWYRVEGNSVRILKGPDANPDSESVLLSIDNSKATAIVSLSDQTARRQISLPPELITNLFDQKREKRRILGFKDFPRTLVDAVTSVEDKRFFEHAGFDPLRIMKAIYVDIKERRAAEGASTITQQLARNLWLTLDKNWKRKLEELAITLILEQKLSKEEIFEYYANQVDLGRRGSFAIRGFGEAAQAYLGKDVRSLTLPEAAMLAGTIQRPSYTSPIRWPERAKQRRNLVLLLMRDNGKITDKEYAEAIAAPLTVAKGGGDSSDAPYFIDLVNDSLQSEFQDYDFQSRGYRIYTSLDPELQRDAQEAVQIGMKKVDEVINKRKKKNPGPAQVALVAIDSANGQILALVGGRSYGLSQLNRAQARRQPGSVFKPFVYAAALKNRTFTPASIVDDEPTQFWFGDQLYEPDNHMSHFFGKVSLRTALAKSLNIPAVKIAQETGYDEVAQLARQVGLGKTIKATPSMALGSYETTPIEIASAYTVFANRGVYLAPSWITGIRDAAGQEIAKKPAPSRRVLDEDVAYIMTNMLEEVVQSGTAAGVRSMGFTFPAAGKTGTSHDGWFAGYTTKLICAVWVGFDDNAELDLEGARSALPIWTEFMMRAHARRPYRNATEFPQPGSVVVASIDPATGKLASASNSNAREEVYLQGTQPQAADGGGGPGTAVSDWGAEPVRPQKQPGGTREVRPVPVPPKPSWAQ